MRHLAAAVAALVLGSTPALAASTSAPEPGSDRPSSEPVKLTDRQLDQVSAGALNLGALLSGIGVFPTVTAGPGSITSLNLAVTQQINVGGGTVVQIGNATATQNVTVNAPAP